MCAEDELRDKCRQCMQLQQQLLLPGNPAMVPELLSSIDTLWPGDKKTAFEQLKEAPGPVAELAVELLSNRLQDPSNRWRVRWECPSWSLKRCLWAAHVKHRRIAGRCNAPPGWLASSDIIEPDAEDLAHSFRSFEELLQHGARPTPPRLLL